MYARFLFLRTINKLKDNVPLGEDIQKNRIARNSLPTVTMYMYSKLNIRHNDKGLIFKSSRHVFQTTSVRPVKLLPFSNGKNTSKPMGALVKGEESMHFLHNPDGVCTMGGTKS